MWKWFSLGKGPTCLPPLLLLPNPSGSTEYSLKIADVFHS